MTNQTGTTENYSAANFPHNMHYVNLTSYAGKGAGKEGRVVVATMSEVETHSFLQTSMDL
jgi:hypothetical protein